ncbi:hypothetical protein AAER46_18515, partial [Acinetobacter baumannii]|uniref:hypothetical protein n=1 Tax=Acinetobacter baumannii TaxID=470 RepID=UPI0031F35987
MSASIVGEDGDDGSALATLTRAQQLWPKVEASQTVKSRSLNRSSSSSTSAWEEAKVRDNLPPPAMRAT